MTTLPETISNHFKGTFGVVKLWPDLQVAEDEVIARLKYAAQKLGLSCIEITPDGRYVSDGSEVPNDALDFVIHLHFETPKAYDFYSLVALWNPLEFYHLARPGVGYRIFSENLISHDNFLSCGSKQADDHVKRQLIKTGRSEEPALTMYHSLAEAFFPPRLGEKNIFYVGINWERLGGNRSRHQDILNLLDHDNCLKIYGPEKVRGMRVWEGFKSYCGPIPFDGVSVIERIAEAGIALVLSSDAHKDAKLMSNRLFEALAAGAVVIADENAFAREHFGDTLLYIDMRLPTEEVYQSILNHVAWIRTNQEEALALATRAQEIYKARFTIDRSITAMYAQAEERLKQLETLCASTLPVTLYFLLPAYCEETLRRHIKSAASQRYRALECVLVIHEDIAEEDKKAIAALLEETSAPLSVQYRDMHSKRRLGEVIAEIQASQPEGSILGFIEPHERIFSDHVARLASMLNAMPDCHCVYSSMVIRKGNLRDKATDPSLVVYQEARLFQTHTEIPLGCARFLIRKHAATTHALDSVLPYLSVKPMAAFAVAGNAKASYYVSVLREHKEQAAESLIRDNEVLIDYIGFPDNEAMHATINNDVLAPHQFSLHNLSRRHKLHLIRDLCDQLPLPSWLRTMLYWAYRQLNRWVG